MTCVAGIVGKDGNIYMGSDKQGIGDDDIGLYRREKIIQKGEMLIGYAGSYRLAQVIEAHRALPETTEHVTITGAYFYIIQKVIPSLIDVLDQNEMLIYEKGKRNPRLLDESTLLIGYKGRLFNVQDEFSLLERVQDFDAIGTGSLAALATLYQRKGQIYTRPKRAIKEAMKTAGEFLASVSKECSDILTLELSEEDKIDREKYRSGKSRMKRIQEKQKKITTPSIGKSSEKDAFPLTVIKSESNIIASGKGGDISSDGTNGSGTPTESLT